MSSPVSAGPSHRGGRRSDGTSAIRQTATPMRDQTFCGCKMTRRSGARFLKEGTVGSFLKWRSFGTFLSTQKEKYIDLPLLYHIPQKNANTFPPKTPPPPHFDPFGAESGREVRPPAPPFRPMHYTSEMHIFTSICKTPPQNRINRPKRESLFNVLKNPLK